MNTVDCDRVGELIDGYLDRRLIARDRRQLETHVGHCPGCGQELRSRASLDRYIRNGIAAAVDFRRLSPAATARIVASTRSAARQASQTTHLIGAVRASAGGLAVLLVVVGLGYSLMHIAPNWPGFSLPLPATAAPVPSLTLGSFAIDPSQLHTGELFNTTIILHNELNVPQPVSPITMDIQGPHRRYHFVFVSDEPVPARATAVLNVPSTWLAEASEDQYQVLAGDILDVPGTYSITLTLLSTLRTPER
jgi:hypothetical protein